jgi:hypothetical protein
VARFTVGTVLGLVLALLVVVPHQLLDGSPTDPQGEPTALEPSLSLPLITRVTAATRSLLQQVLPSGLMAR